MSAALGMGYDWKTYPTSVLIGGRQAESRFWRKGQKPEIFGTDMGRMHRTASGNSLFLEERDKAFEAAIKFFSGPKPENPDDEVPGKEIGRFKVGELDPRVKPKPEYSESFLKRLEQVKPGNWQNNEDVTTMNQSRCLAVMAKIKRQWPETGGQAPKKVWKAYLAMRTHYFGSGWALGLIDLWDQIGEHNKGWK